jgi:mediator of RNA polymerase II transcription subunit 7
MDEEQPEVLSSFFPGPPPFYKHFTAENVAALKQFKADNPSASNDGASSPQLSASQLLSLPTELRYLVPPEPPAEDHEFRVFGETTKARGNDEFEGIVEWIGRSMNERQPPLKDWEYQRLYPASPPSPAPGDDPIDPSKWSLDRQRYLFSFLRSALLQFVGLLGIVAENPTSEEKDEKLKNILTLVTNMHALINEYRPHQARETLIHIMELQLERKKAEVAGIRRMSHKVQETLRDFATNAPDATTGLAPEYAVAPSAEEMRKESQRHMWAVMDEILGS